MPYEINKYKDGFRVCKVDGSKCFCNNAISLDKAKKQRIALYLSEHKKYGGMTVSYTHLTLPTIYSV